MQIDALTVDAPTPTAVYIPPPIEVAVLGADTMASAALAQALSLDSEEAPVTPALSVVVDALPPLLQKAHALQEQEGDAAAAAMMALAIQHKAKFRLTLLLGTNGSASPGLVESRLRAALHAADVPYQALYGDGAMHAHQARKALQATAGRRPPAPPAPELAGLPARLRAWGCEKCSDPECEHQLFQRLLAAR